MTEGAASPGEVRDEQTVVDTRGHETGLDLETLVHEKHRLDCAVAWTHVQYTRVLRDKPPATEFRIQPAAANASPSEMRIAPFRETVVATFSVR